MNQKIMACLIVACAGIFAFYGLYVRETLLFTMINQGEVSILHAFPALLGTLLLLIACLKLFTKRFKGWKIFAACVIAFALSLLTMPMFVLGMWPFYAIAACVAGALLAFPRKTQAADETAP